MGKERAERDELRQRRARRGPRSGVACTCAAAALLIFNAPLAAHAQQSGFSSRWMTGDEIRAAFSGVLFAGDHVDGYTFTETFPVGGEGVFVIESVPPRKHSSDWSIRRDTLCTFYVDVTGACFLIERLGPNCFEIYEPLLASRAGVAREEVGEVVYTARTWRDSSPPTCDNVPVS